MFEKDIPSGLENWLQALPVPGLSEYMAVPSSNFSSWAVTPVQPGIVLMHFRVADNILLRNMLPTAYTVHPCVCTLKAWIAVHTALTIGPRQ